MSSNGYDMSTSIYSPDGKIFQLEYANKSVENCSTSIGMCGKDSIVLCVLKKESSKLYEHNCIRRIYTVDYNIGMVYSGLSADGRMIAHKSMDICREYRLNKGLTITVSQLCRELVQQLFAQTLYSAYRPYGCSMLFAGFECGKPKLFRIEPTADYVGYHACAIGKCNLEVHTELEKLDLQQLSPVECVNESLRIVHSVAEEGSATFEHEVSWITAENGFKHEMIPDDVLNSAIEYALASTSNN